MAALEIVRVPCLRDNYGWVIHDPDTGATAVVDTPDEHPLLDVIASRGWTLSHILNTHHHWDHTGKNLRLQERTGCTIVGPRPDRERIPGIQVEVDDGDVFELGSKRARIFHTPGHTTGHIVYWFEEDEALFCGDVIFAMGCGRLFEGTPSEMWESFRRLRALPDATRVYCAHEYTLSNARFALTVDPDNQDLVQRADAVARAREQGEPTIPTTIGLEKRTNPFMRVDDPALQAQVGLSGAPPAEVFGEIRGRKDNF